MKERRCAVQQSVAVAVNSFSLRAAFSFFLLRTAFRVLCDFVYNSIACHDICIWLEMWHKINETLLLNKVWWVQALDDELEDYFIHTCLGHSSSLPQLGFFGGWAKEPSVDDFLLNAVEVSCVYLYTSGVFLLWRK